MLKAPPFPDSDRLIALVYEARSTNQTELGASQAIYFTYRGAAHEVIGVLPACLLERDGQPRMD